MANIKAEYVEHSGSDLSIVNAARVSFSKASDWHIEKFEDEEKAQRYADSVLGADLDHEYIMSDFWYGGYPVKHLKAADAKLIKYLARENHEMPFAHPHISLRVSAPLPIARQAYKSKIGFVESEESRRYIKSTPEIYVPDFFRSAPEGSIKQGSGGEHEHSEEWLGVYEAHTQKSVGFYEDMIRRGICPEQARFILPQGTIVNWVWTGSLLAFVRFYKLRADSHAQREIQELAKLVAEKVQPLYPVAWDVLVNGNHEKAA